MEIVDPDWLWLVIVGFIIAFVLAFGLGANDVANSFGTSIGSKVLTIRQACILGTIFEVLGAILVGARVSNTIRKGIISPDLYPNGTEETFMAGNAAALSGSCFWLLAATLMKLPVSGTHSIVGATLGFSIVVNGLKGIGWVKLSMIAASWFISPVMSGLVSCGLFLLIDHLVLKKEKPLEPGLRLLPIFYACTLAVNLFSVFYEGSELLHFDKIPLYGTFILTIGPSIIIAILVRIFIVPRQRQKILSRVMNSSPTSTPQDTEQANSNDTRTQHSEDKKNTTIQTTNETLPRQGVKSIKHVVFAKEREAQPRLGYKGPKYIPRRLQARHAWFNHRQHWDVAQWRDFVYANELRFTWEEVDGVRPIRYTETRIAETGCVGSLDNGGTLLGTEQGSTSDIRDGSPAPVALPITNTENCFEETGEVGQEMVMTDRPRGIEEAIDQEIEVKIQQNGSVHTGEELQPLHPKSVDDNRNTTKILHKPKETDDLDEEKKREKARDAVQDKPETAGLFSFLQVLTAVFGSFAHGGNDVSNAIGPLVALWITATTGSAAQKAPVPIWILVYGGAGISFGLWILGRRVMKTMGEDLTKITPSSGFCIEVGSALTVLVASNIGIPISTTHCKVGSVVCVGRVRSRESVDWKLFRNIAIAWFVTLPVSGLLSAAFMAMFRAILGHY